MKAYKLLSAGAATPTIILDAQGLFYTTFEEFKKTYGFHRLDSRDTQRYMRGLTNSRMSLSKDRTRLRLSCNPMTDDLQRVFGEWISKKPGFTAVSEEDLVAEIPVENFDFPY